MAIAGGAGLKVDLDPLVELRGGSGETCLFGEGPGGIVLAASRDQGRRCWSAPRPRAWRRGDRRGDGERISISAAERDVSVAVTDAERAWLSLPERL